MLNEVVSSPMLHKLTGAGQCVLVGGGSGRTWGCGSSSLMAAD